MFSQFNSFMNVVESHLVQPQPRRAARSATGSQEFSPERPDHPPRSSSSSSSHNVAGSPISTSQLAESALSNLRKSLATRTHGRPGTPQGHERNERHGSPQPDKELRPVTKVFLEERLRASFAIGDASTSTTPDAVSHEPSPKPTPTLESKIEKVLSPASTPLPESPQQEAEKHAEPDGLELPGPALIDEVYVSREEVSGARVQGEDEKLEGGKDLAHECMNEPSREADTPLPESPPPEESALTGDISSVSQICIGETNSGNAVDHKDSATVQLLALRLKDATDQSSQLQAIMDAANSVLSECSTVGSIADTHALRTYLQDTRQKLESNETEIKGLSAKLANYDERFGELRETHRLESRSQSDLVDSLRQQLHDAAVTLSSARTQLAQRDSEQKQHLAELGQLRSESQKLKDVAKEEEEKRVKAISLLKTVRQKLVKAEKERDDLNKEVTTVRERGNSDLEKEKTERVRLEKEIISVRAEREKDLAGIKAHFDRELALMKERLDKEYLARVGQFELEAAAAKTSHQKDITSLRGQIHALEGSVRSLNTERDSLFDQIQLRQAELESSQSHLESLQSTTSELHFQLREATERAALLAEELSEARQEQEFRAHKPHVSGEEEKRIRMNVEAKYDLQILELTNKITAIEKERAETEAVLTRTVQQKVQEIENLKRQAEATAHTKDRSDDEVAQLKKELGELLEQITALKSRLKSLKTYEERCREQEASIQSLREETAAQVQHLLTELNATKDRETQLRALHKNLRDDLRKVQSSAALLERQRNPGVGYWSSVTRQETNDRRQSVSSQSDHASSQSPRSGSPAPAKSDEEVNLEYLRNVILQFLEHKEMRPQLVRVLSIILQFTPQETRRVIAKV